MRKLLFLSICAASASAFGQESWLGLYLQGSKIGYSYSSTSNATLNKLPAVKTYSATVMNAGLLGQSISIRVYSTSWTDKKGHPLQMNFEVDSAGRSQRVNATFYKSNILTKIDNSGEKTSKTIPLPRDASVVDDAVEAVMEKGTAVGKKCFYYVLDPMTVSLVKNQVTLEGPGSTDVHGKQVSGTKIEISEPRSTSYCYLTTKGDLIKVEGPMGMEMLPESKEQALQEAPVTEASTDLAFTTCITPDKPITDVNSIKELDLRITGHDLSALPSDSHQTISRDGDGWKVSIHPIGFSPENITIHSAAQEKAAWVKPSLDIPSGKKEFIDLSSKIIAGSGNVEGASRKIHDYVYRTMHPDAGIGVLRDATEILKTKEGVCRDYAVLTATLLRAAHVPTQLVSGLVYADGAFYYHAWAEVWDGSHWVGIDSTLPKGNLTAAHIQLAQGDVEQAFTFTFLDKVKVQVLDARRA